MKLGRKERKDDVMLRTATVNSYLVTGSIYK